MSDTTIYIPDAFDRTTLQRNFFKEQRRLSEGLIASYPQSVSYKTLCRFYPFVKGVDRAYAQDDADKRYPYDGYLLCKRADRRFFNITIEFSYYNERDDFFLTVRDLFGWEPHSCNIFYTESDNSRRCVSVYSDYMDKVINDINLLKGYVDFIDLFFVAKIPKEIVERSKYYYHAFPEEYFGRCKRDGLCPHSAGYTMMDRIYLTDSLDLIGEMVNPMYPFLKNCGYCQPKYYGRYLFRVSGDVIHELFEDVKHQDSYFTMENICPEHIEVFLRNGQWIKIADVNIYSPLATIENALYLLRGQTFNLNNPVYIDAKQIK